MTENSQDLNANPERMARSNERETIMVDLRAWIRAFKELDPEKSDHPAAVLSELENRYSLLNAEEFGAECVKISDIISQRSKILEVLHKQKIMEDLIFIQEDMLKTFEFLASQAIEFQFKKDELDELNRKAQDISILEKYGWMIFYMVFYVVFY